MTATAKKTVLVERAPRKKVIWLTPAQQLMGYAGAYMSFGLRDSVAMKLARAMYVQIPYRN